MSYRNNGVEIFTHPDEIPADKTGLQYHQYGSVDPEHPIRKPGHAFSVGEQVSAKVGGRPVPARVVEVKGDALVGFAYTVAHAAESTVSETDLAKA